MEGVDVGCGYVWDELYVGFVDVCEVLDRGVVE